MNKMRISTETETIKKYPMEILKTNKQNISNEDKPKENYNEAHNQTA